VIDVAFTKNTLHKGKVFTARIGYYFSSHRKSILIPMPFVYYETLATIKTNHSSVDSHVPKTAPELPTIWSHSEPMKTGLCLWQTTWRRQTGRWRLLGSLVHRGFRTHLGNIGSLIFAMPLLGERCYATVKKNRLSSRAPTSLSVKQNSDPGVP